MIGESADRPKFEDDTACAAGRSHRKQRESMRDLMTKPASSEEDLGIPMPESAHACSVCLPTWASVIGYEEGRDKVIRRMRAGYPRFFQNPLVARATQMAWEELGEEGEKVFLFPTKISAQRAQRWIERRGEVAARSAGFQGLQAVIVPERAARQAVDYQRFTGEMISSRLAEDLLSGGKRDVSKRHLIERRIAKLYGAEAGQTSVFSSGMSAVTAVLRSLPSSSSGKKSLQLEFPYVDSLKVQETIGGGVVFLNETVGESFDEALQRIRNGEFSAVFTEIPSNPLLRCVDLPKVSAACREGRVPLIVDDSAAGPANVRVLPWADIVTCSLTKWLSGQGDVLGGAAIVRADSIFAGEMAVALTQESKKTSPLYVGDAEKLLSNLKDYPARTVAPNENAMRLVSFLVDHPAVEEVWHPSRVQRERYEKLMAPNGGYGGLFSFSLKNPKRSAKVFDTLDLSKGPGFGTPFTLVCPYVLLAHYTELEWAAGCGVPSHLIRVSCGQEDAAVLEGMFEEALKHG